MVVSEGLEKSPFPQLAFLFHGFPFSLKRKENPYIMGLQGMASAGTNTYYNNSVVNSTFDGVVCQVKPAAIKQEDHWLFQSSHVRKKVFTKPIFENCVAHPSTLVSNCTVFSGSFCDIMSHTNVVPYTQQEVADIHQKQNHIQAQCTWFSHMLE